jgi:hypothetical protein
MTNQEIEMKLRDLVQQERRINNEILLLLNLADERKLYLEKGFSSLFDWLTRGFGYSSSAAYRRIESARMIRDVPDVVGKIESGSVNLTTLSRARCAIRAQEKISGKKLSKVQKAQVVGEIENKSAVQAEAALLSLFPQTAGTLKPERCTVIDEKTSRVAVNLSHETLAQLERVKELLSHSIPDGNLAEVIGQLTEFFLKKNDPLIKPEVRRQVELNKGTAAASMERFCKKKKYVQRVFLPFQKVPHRFGIGALLVLDSSFSTVL